MLPFLKRKDEAAASAPIDTVKRKSDEDQDQDMDHLELAMEELHDALNKKDFALAADIFRSAFQMCEDSPHHEGPHVEE